MTQKASEIRNVREETNVNQNNTEFFVDGINLKCLSGIEVESGREIETPI